ncbi:MAG: hypothetical protein Q9169_000268 [Polycauliona sp. 2 TL-2023]
MLPNRHFLVTAIPTFSLLINTGSAQQDFNDAGCEDWYDPVFNSDGSAFNASSSYQVTGFSPPGSTSQPQDLTYNTAVQVNPEGDNAHAIWIELANGTDIGYNGLPYLGCLTALYELPENTVQRGQDDNGDCTETFDQDCVDAILSQSRSLVPGPGGSEVQRCTADTKIMVPSACRRYITGEFFVSSSWEWIGNWTDSDGTDKQVCNPQNQTRVKNAAIGWGSLYADDPRNNTSTTSDLLNDVNSIYDREVTDVFAVLATVWAEDGPVGSGVTWSDSRLTCMNSAQRIKSGSRAPVVMEAPTTSTTSTTTSSGTTPRLDTLVKGMWMTAAMVLCMMVL